jgi:CheY-like chemotaxis protein
MLKNSQYDFLIVDDQAVVIQLMRSILRNNGCRKVYTAKDGKSALGILDKNKNPGP